MQTARAFIEDFEKLVRQTVIETLRAAAESKGVPLATAGKYSVCDMTTAFALRRKGVEWTLIQNECSSKVEVPPGIMDLN
jgi:hypothetical protein